MQCFKYTELKLFQVFYLFLVKQVNLRLISRQLRDPTREAFLHLVHDYA